MCNCKWLWRRVTDWVIIGNYVFIPFPLKHSMELNVNFEKFLLFLISFHQKLIICSVILQEMPLIPHLRLVDDSPCFGSFFYRIWPQHHHWAGPRWGPTTTEAPLDVYWLASRYLYYYQYQCICLFIRLFLQRSTTTSKPHILYLLSSCVSFNCHRVR